MEDYNRRQSLSLLSTMESITVPSKDFGSSEFSELKQISLESDDGIGAVNDLLADGWKLLHIGHLSDRTVYVLGKQAPASQRRAGFLA